jgi:hypothetical protein
MLTWVHLGTHHRAQDGPEASALVCSLTTTPDQLILRGIALQCSKQSSSQLGQKTITLGSVDNFSPLNEISISFTFEKTCPIL